MPIERVEIGMKWETFREVAFTFQIPESELYSDALQFVIEAEWALAIDSIRMLCTVRVKPNPEVEPFLVLTTETIIAIQGLAEATSKIDPAILTTNQALMPYPLLASIAGIGLSTTRGVLWEKSKTLGLPGIDRLLIPTINIETILPPMDLTPPTTPQPSPLSGSPSAQ